MPVGLTDNEAEWLLNELGRSFKQDVVQDILVALLSQPERPQNLMGWCLTTARLRRIDDLRYRTQKVKQYVPESRLLTYPCAPEQERRMSALEILHQLPTEALRAGFGNRVRADNTYYHRRSRLRLRYRDDLL